MAQEHSMSIRPAQQGQTGSFLAEELESKIAPARLDATTFPCGCGAQIPVPGGGTLRQYLRQRLPAMAGTFVSLAFHHPVDSPHPLPKP